MRTTVLLGFASLLGMTTATLLLDRTTSRAAPGPVAPSQPYGLHAPANVPQVYSANTSCASSACHGNGRIGQTGGEQSTWASQLRMKYDPHHRAYSVLFNETSQRMMKWLNHGRPVVQQRAAHETELCLKCHAIDQPKTFDGEALNQRVLSEGVSCDACHGASANWLSAHYEAGWSNLTAREKFDRHGFRPLKNFTARTLVCASCHIGDTDREVNHDLIAAGHPRLAFESAKFHTSEHYLQHWKEPSPSFELRAWYIGQWVNLRSAVALLESRARRVEARDANTPWPEFSEGSCYACHKSIGESKSVAPRPAERPLGSIPWQTWNTSLAELLPKIQQEFLGRSYAPEQAKDLQNQLLALQSEMQRSRPRAAEVVKLAEPLRLLLDGWLYQLQLAEDTAHRDDLNSDAAKRVGLLIARHALVDADWDASAQHYLALAAIYHAKGGNAGPLNSWGPALHRLKQVFAFKPGENSPRSYQRDQAAAVFSELAAIMTRTNQ